MANRAPIHGSFHLLLLPLLLLVLNLQSSFSELQRLQHAPKPDGSLSLLVVGDWGRKGNYNQTEVAAQMGRIGKDLDVEFIISTGDNFYEDGLTGVDDSSFGESFSDIYTAESLQKPWYNILGNHDYRGDALAQFSPVLRKLDSRWICSRNFILNTEFAEFFFVDTTPFVLKYWTHPKDDKYDWRGVSPRETYLAKLLKDLDLALKESSAKWKIVIGHHTIRSVGEHGDTQELKELMLPILEANNVDLYINGHDHCLEHISGTHSQIQFMTSGGGSKAYRGGIVDGANKDGLKFYYDGQGFISLQLTSTDAKIAFYDISGNILHNWSTSKQFHFAF